jgi:hypothetical protein
MLWHFVFKLVFFIYLRLIYSLMYRGFRWDRAGWCPRPRAPRIPGTSPHNCTDRNNISACKSRKYVNVTYVCTWSAGMYCTCVWVDNAQLQLRIALPTRAIAAADVSFTHNSTNISYGRWSSKRPSNLRMIRPSDIVGWLNILCMSSNCWMIALKLDI